MRSTVAPTPTCDLRVSCRAVLKATYESHQSDLTASETHLNAGPFPASEANHTAVNGRGVKRKAITADQQVCFANSLSSSPRAFHSMEVEDPEAFSHFPLQRLGYIIDGSLDFCRYSEGRATTKCDCQWLVLESAHVVPACCNLAQLDLAVALGYMSPTNSPLCCCPCIAASLCNCWN